MQEQKKIRIPIDNYYNDDDQLEVFLMTVRDNSGGLLLMEQLVRADFEDSAVCFVKPEREDTFSLPGVYIRPRSLGEDSVVLFVFTLEKELLVISNDEYCAKNALVELIFGDKIDFNNLVDQLVITENWTASGKFFHPFFEAFLGLPVHPDDEEPDAGFYPAS